MKGFLISVFFVATSFCYVKAQSNHGDSLSVIEREREELRQQQARIKAVQDSLVKERQRLVNEQQQIQSNSNPVVPNTIQRTTKLSTKRDVKNIIGLAPIHMFISGIELHYERAISKNSSLQLSLGYHNMDNYPEEENNGTVYITDDRGSSPTNMFLSTRSRVACSGVRIKLQYKYYLFEEVGVLKKLHIGPSLLYKQDEMTIMTNYVSGVYFNPEYNQYFAQALTGAVNVGYNIHVLRYFSIDPYIGFSYTYPFTDKFYSKKVQIDFLNPYTQGLLFHTGVTIGFTF